MGTSTEFDMAGVYTGIYNICPGAAASCCIIVIVIEAGLAMGDGRQTPGAVVLSESVVELDNTDGFYSGDLSKFSYQVCSNSILQ